MEHQKDWKLGEINSGYLSNVFTTDQENNMLLGSLEVLESTRLLQSRYILS